MFFISPFLGIIIGKYIRNIFALAFASLILTGVGSAIENGIYSEIGKISYNDAAQKIVIHGFMILPIITFISALFTRRAVLKKAKQSPKPPPKLKGQAQVMLPASKKYINLDDEEQAWSEAHNEFTNDRREGLWIKCLYSCEQNEYEAQKLYVETRVEELLSIVEEKRVSDQKQLKKLRREQLRKEHEKLTREGWLIVLKFFVFLFVAIVLFFLFVYS